MLLEVMKILDADEVLNQKFQVAGKDIGGLKGVCYRRRQHDRIRMGTPSWVVCRVGVTGEWGFSCLISFVVSGVMLPALFNLRRIL